MRVFFCLLKNQSLSDKAAGASTGATAGAGNSITGAATTATAVRNGGANFLHGRVKLKPSKSLE
ncbi:MAG: hypothetical protein ABI644_05560 [Arenimonas sp.]